MAVSRWVSGAEAGNAQYFNTTQAKNKFQIKVTKELLTNTGIWHICDKYLQSDFSSALMSCAFVFLAWLNTIEVWRKKQLFSQLPANSALWQWHSPHRFAGLRVRAWKEVFTHAHNHAFVSSLTHARTLKHRCKNLVVEKFHPSWDAIWKFKHKLAACVDLAT